MTAFTVPGIEVVKRSESAYDVVVRVADDLEPVPLTAGLSPQDLRYLQLGMRLYEAMATQNPVDRQVRVTRLREDLLRDDPMRHEAELISAKEDRKTAEMAMMSPKNHQPKVEVSSLVREWVIEVSTLDQSRADYESQILGTLNDHVRQNSDRLGLEPEEGIGKPLKWFFEHVPDDEIERMFGDDPRVEACDDDQAYLKACNLLAINQFIQEIDGRDDAIGVVSTLKPLVEVHEGLLFRTEFSDVFLKCQEGDGFVLNIVPLENVRAACAAMQAVMDCSALQADDITNRMNAQYALPLAERSPLLRGLGGTGVSFQADLNQLCEGAQTLGAWTNLERISATFPELQNVDSHETRLRNGGQFAQVFGAWPQTFSDNSEVLRQAVEVENSLGYTATEAMKQLAVEKATVLACLNTCGRTNVLDLPAPTLDPVQDDSPSPM